MVSKNGQLNGKPGRPPKCPEYSTCPNVQWCNVEKKCKKACTGNRNTCTGKSCGDKGNGSGNGDEPKQDA